MVALGFARRSRIAVLMTGHGVPGDRVRAHVDRADDALAQTDGGQHERATNHRKDDGLFGGARAASVIPEAPAICQNLPPEAGFYVLQWLRPHRMLLPA